MEIVADSVNMPWNKEERAAYNKEYRLKNLEKLRTYARSSVKREQNNKNRRLQRTIDGDRIRALDRAGYARHKEEENAYKRKRRSEDVEGARARDRQRYADNREKIKAQVRNWRTLNAEDVRARDRQRNQTPERRRNHVISTTKRRTTAPPPATTRVQELLLEVSCYYCCVHISINASRYSACKTTIDHMTPLARGGDNTDINLVAACLHCNNSKGAKTAEEFIAFLYNSWLPVQNKP